MVSTTLRDIVFAQLGSSNMLALLPLFAIHSSRCSFFFTRYEFTATPKVQSGKLEQDTGSLTSVPTCFDIINFMIRYLSYYLGWGQAQTIFSYCLSHLRLSNTHVLWHTYQMNGFCVLDEISFLFTLFCDDFWAKGLIFKKKRP